MTGKFIPLALLAITLPTLAVGAEDPDEDWLNQPDPEAVHRSINEGKLVFLPKHPKKPVHHHHNTIVITPASLDTGWVKLIQCHENMDKFPRAQVVYNRKRIRNLRITAFRHIGRAWVEKASVQLQEVKKGAVLCVQADSLALIKQPDGSFMLRNGPFMRRFLDGYFPMRVSIDIKLPAGIVFASIKPAIQPGFRVIHHPRAIHIDAWFEGRLFTRVRLRYSKDSK